MEQRDTMRNTDIERLYRMICSEFAMAISFIAMPLVPNGNHEEATANGQFHSPPLVPRPAWWLFMATMMVLVCTAWHLETS